MPRASLCRAEFHTRIQCIPSQAGLGFIRYRRRKADWVLFSAGQHFIASDGSESPCGFPVPLLYSWPTDEPASKPLKQRQRRQSPGTGTSCLLTTQPCAQPAASSSRLGFTGLLLSACSYSKSHTALPVSPRCRACPHRFCQRSAALEGRECPGAEAGEGEMCRAELWLLSLP